jgi:hypothetical protein
MDLSESGINRKASLREEIFSKIRLSPIQWRVVPEDSIVHRMQISIAMEDRVLM